MLQTERKKGEFVIKITSKAIKQMYEITRKKNWGSYNYYIKDRGDPLYRMALKYGNSKHSEHIS